MESAESFPGMQEVPVAVGFRPPPPIRSWRLAVAGHRQAAWQGSERRSFAGI